MMIFHFISLEGSTESRWMSSGNKIKHTSLFEEPQHHHLIFSNKVIIHFKLFFHNLVRNIHLQRPLLKEKNGKNCFWYCLINGLHYLWNSSCQVALLFNKCKFFFLQILLILLSLFATKHRWISKASNMLFILLVFLVLFDAPLAQPANSCSLAQNADVPLIYFS